MKRYRGWTVIVALVAVVAAVAVFRSPHPTETVRTTEPASSWTLFAGIGSASDPKAAVQFTVPTLKQYEGGSFDLENLTVVKFVEKYRSAASGSGRDAAYAAYRIYQAEKMCAGVVETQRLGRNVLDDEAEACEGLPPLWLNERYQFLRQAAQGGIEGTAITFYEEGPPGYMPGSSYLSDWPDDAIRFLRESGERGDFYALHRLSYVYQQGQLAEPDPQKALTYKAAMVVLHPYYGRTLEDTPIIKKLSAGLSPDQIAAALQGGRAIAAQCCDKR